MKKNELSYLQMPLPEGRKNYRIAKRVWSGLNYRQKIDSGYLSAESNISTAEAPYLVPSPDMIAINYNNPYDFPISMFGFDDFLLIIYRQNGAIKVDYIKISKNNSTYTYTKYTGTLKANGATENDDFPRCIVQFNHYDNPTDPVTGGYTKKLLIFPDKMSMNFEINNNNFDILPMDVTVKSYTPEEGESNTPPEDADRRYYYKNTSTNEVYRWSDEESEWKVSTPPSFPPIEYATVHLSRLFGVGNGRVYASGFNDYANWMLDNVNEYNESNAWCSPSQSNVKAGGAFTGITTFQNHVICFKKDFMHEIYNNKNPFRIQDIYAEGSIDNRTIQDVDGKLIFVSDDNVKIYTGSNPRIISYNLNMRNYNYAVSGTDERNYYLYCEAQDHNGHIFVYDTFVEQWSERSVDSRVLHFALNKYGMYMFCADGYIYKLDTNSYAGVDWSFETDLITNQTVNIKHIKKIQFFAYLGDNAQFKVYPLYDGEEFDVNNIPAPIYTVNKSGQQAIRFKPRNTANYGFKLHFEGKGYVRLYEMEIFVEQGGELYV